MLQNQNAQPQSLNRSGFFANDKKGISLNKVEKTNEYLLEIGKSVLVSELEEAMGFKSNEHLKKIPKEAAIKLQKALKKSLTK